MTIDRDDVSFGSAGAATDGPLPVVNTRDLGPGGLKKFLAAIERALIVEALRDAKGNKARAARSLGISERLIGLRVKRLGIDWRALRPRRLPPYRS